MKRVLFLIHDLGGGGAEKVLVNLVNRLDRRRFEVSVTALFGGGVNEKHLAPDVRFRACFPWAFPGNSHAMKLFPPERLHRRAVRERYDLEVAYLEGPSARVIAGGTDPSVKRVAWIHSILHDRREAYGSFRSPQEASRCYGVFDRVVSVSQDIRKRFTDFFPGCTRQDVLYNTNDTDRIFRLKDVPVPEGLFPDGEFPYALVGRLNPVKGYDRMIRVHRRLRDAGFPVHAYLLGDGPLRASLARQAADAGIADSFTFLGYDDNPYRIVSRCRLFVCSSRSEGFSTAATEALLVGTPVLTTDVSGMRELLGPDREYGVIVPQDEDTLFSAFAEFLTNPERLTHYRAKAAERGAAFSADRTVRAVETFFESLL